MSGWVFDFKNWIKSNNFVFIIHSYRWKIELDFLGKRLESIFVEYTTHQWKNGWEHEGDRLSKEYTIQENIPWNNLFLLQKTNNYMYGDGILLDGPRGFKIELHNEDSNKIRIDIEVKQMGIDIFYYVDNELDWLARF